MGTGSGSPQVAELAWQSCPRVLCFDSGQGLGIMLLTSSQGIRLPLIGWGTTLEEPLSWGNSLWGTKMLSRLCLFKPKAIPCAQTKMWKIVSVACRRMNIVGALVIWWTGSVWRSYTVQSRTVVWSQRRKRRVSSWCEIWHQADGGPREVNFEDSLPSSWY